MGVHSGEGRLLGNTYVGLDVHRAARIAAAAHGGQIVLSDTTRALAAANLPPGVELRDLGEHRLKDLEGPQRLFQLVAPDLPSDFPPLRSLRGLVGNLPTQLTSFVGRKREKRELLELLGANRIVTLTGPGGTGKTRLSIEVAAAYVGQVEDSVHFVALAPISDADLVIPTIAATLGVREIASRPIRDSLIERLRERSMLLVLDNFEQLTMAAPAVGELLGAAPELKALVTSREPLRISGEQEYPLPPLDVPDTHAEARLDALVSLDSVELFVQRARLVRPGFDLSAANAGAVAEICARLDGLPLAIELAAARSRLFEPHDLLSRLDRRLTFLAGGRDVSERQRTLRGAIDWSHELLGEAEQVLFRRMSVFAGGCTLEAVEAVCAMDEPDGDTVEVVSSLHAKSLLGRDETASDGMRVAMLETIRLYALERLEASPEATQIRSRHAAFFLDLAEQASRHVRGPDGRHWLDRLEGELDNFRAAIRWAIDSGDLEPGLRLAAALDPLWIFLNHQREGRRHLDDLLAQPRAEGLREARAAALGASASIAVWQADYSAGSKLARESLEIYREIGDVAGIARQLSSLGYAAIVADAVDAHRLFAESIAAFRDAGELQEMGESLIGIAMTELQLGRIAGAMTHLHEATATFEHAGDAPLALIAAGVLGMCDRLAGDLTAARRRYRDVLIRSHLVGADVVTSLPLAALADLALLEGDAERAAVLIGAQARLVERLGGTPTFDLVGIPDVGDRARAELEPARYEGAVARGRSMPLDEVVRLALLDAGDVTGR
jgi:predicted ATPase